MPGWTVDQERSGRTAVLREETAAEVARRELAASSDGLVLGLTERGNGYTAVELASGTSPARAEQVEAWLLREYGLSLIQWDPINGRTIAGKLTDSDREMRARIASLLGVHPHEVTIQVTSDAEGVAALQLKAPAGRAADGESRVAQMRRVMMQAVPGAHADWAVTVDPVTDVTKMERRAVRVLPEIAPGRDLLPATIDPQAWKLLPIGVTPEGEVTGAALGVAPHTLLVGGSGSGKSVALRMLMVSALLRGFEVVAVDPTKRLAGLKQFEPWTRGMYTASEAEAAAVLRAVYAEVERRVDLIDAHQGENWKDLIGTPDEVRPWLVIIDEVAGLVQQDGAKPAGLAKDDPLVIEWQERAAAKATILSMMARIAAEARSAGIHLVAATQRADVIYIPGPVRNNLGTKLQLVPPTDMPNDNTLGMTFSSDLVGTAREVIRKFSHPDRPGMALWLQDGGRLDAIRIGLFEPDEVTKIMQDYGVPLSAPLIPNHPRKSAPAPIAEAAPTSTAPAAADDFDRMFG